MALSSRDLEREEERRLNKRTLVIASAASATAAAVTSQLWIHGTWIAAAVTPVLVALISEAMHRPTERIARARTRERPALSDEPRAKSGPVPETGPVSVYRQPTARTPRRRIAVGAVVATAAIALLVAVVTITGGELIVGDSLGGGDRKTTFLAGSKDAEKPQSEQPAKSTPEGKTPPAEGEAPEEPATTDPAAEEPVPAPPTETPPGEPLPETTPLP